jgi:hypothetical protein
MRDDDADWGNLGLPPDMAERAHDRPKRAGARIKLKRGFVIVPAVWASTLKEAPSAATWEVALELLLRWRTNPSARRRVRLSNKLQCSRWAKYRALAWLEERGLVLVDREPPL